MKTQKTKAKFNKLMKNANGFLFVAFLACVFVLLVINSTAIQFYMNGFGGVFDQQMQIYVFDVGQASANLVITPDKQSFLIDTGSQDSAQTFVEELSCVLSQNGVDEIDYLLLTHSDEDHIGGATSVLEKFEVKNILRPKILTPVEAQDTTFTYKIVDTQIYISAMEKVSAETNCNVSFVTSGTYQFGALKLQIFAAEQDYYEATNDYSPFVAVSYANRTALFTGDCDFSRENEFVGLAEPFKVDFLQVAHHGAASSCSKEFLQIVQPTHALISCAYRDYPNKSTLSRLQESGCESILTTKQDGTIGIGVGADGSYSIKTRSFHFDTPLYFSILVLITLYIMHFVQTQRKVPRKLQYMQKYNLGNAKKSLYK